MVMMCGGGKYVCMPSATVDIAVAICLLEQVGRSGDGDGGEEWRW